MSLIRVVFFVDRMRGQPNIFEVLCNVLPPRKMLLSMIAPALNEADGLARADNKSETQRMKGAL